MNDLNNWVLPPAATELAREQDKLYLFIQWMSVFFFILVIGIMVFFVIRYRRRSADDKTPNFTHNTPLEIFWSAIPLALLAIIFFWGFELYMKMRVPPHRPMEITLTARRWQWQFNYPDSNIVQFNDLVVPAGKPVKLLMNSEDVIHSFFVPDFRIKGDVIPNRYTTVWFQAEEPGEHVIFCAEYCGDQHSTMLGKVIVKTPEEYQEWFETGGVGDVSQLSSEEYGKLLYTAKACNTCHSVDGSVLTGPSFKGIFGHEATLASGETVLVDENYLRESIVDPQAKIVQGYQPVMPTYAGTLDDQQITALIAYIKSLNAEEQVEE